jgi:GrpB-like predicted nucleotidyltransferase (UPF0157 family)
MAIRYAAPKKLLMRPQDSVGMRRGVEITIAPYSPLWPEEFGRVRAELVAALPEWILSIDHVGSTSVPGLDAKPIIDISVAVPDLQASLCLTPLLEALGFTYRPDDGLPDRHYLPRTVGGLRRHHLSLAEPESWHRRNSLTFREALRDDPDLARSYGALKRQLAASAGPRRIEYLNGKTEFILGVLKANGCKPSPGYPLHDP